jgi:ABC-type amino acid transport substrate-binding protein
LLLAGVVVLFGQVTAARPLDDVVISGPTQHCRLSRQSAVRVPERGGKLVGIDIDLGRGVAARSGVSPSSTLRLLP